MNWIIDREWDEYFGIPDNQILNTSIYSELSNQALSTSYNDYLQIFKQLNAGQTLVDIGAGFCRGSLLVARMGLPVRCISVELESQRMESAFNFLPQARGKELIHADLFSDQFQLPLETDAIFLYLPAGLLLARIIQLLKQLKKPVTVFAIESHGQLIPSLDHLGIFKDKQIIGQTSDQRHDGNIYRYQFDVDADSELARLAMAGLRTDLQLNIHSDRGVWVAQAHGMELSVYNQRCFLETLLPKRMLALDDLDYELVTSSEILQYYQRPGVTKVFCRPAGLEMIEGSFRQI